MFVEEKQEKSNKRKLTLDDDNSQGNNDFKSEHPSKKMKINNMTNEGKVTNVTKQVNDILSGKRENQKSKLVIPSSSSSSSSEEDSDDSIERMKSVFRKKNKENEIAQTEMKINLNLKDVSVDKQLDALGIKSTALERLKKFQRSENG